MIAKLRWKNGMVDEFSFCTAHMTNKFMRERFYEDKEGLHIDVSAFDSSSEFADGWVPISTCVVLPADKMNEADIFVIDGKIVWFERPPVDANIKQMLEDNRRLLMAYMQDKREAKKSFDNLRSADSVEDLFGGFDTSSIDDE